MGLEDTAWDGMVQNAEATGSLQVEGWNKTLLLSS
jgi:hypothetical protein